MLAQEKNEEKRRAALAAFKDKLDNLTHQAKARAQRIVAVDNARKQYVLTKMPEKGAQIAKITHASLYRGTVKDVQENTKQCVLFEFSMETEKIEKSSTLYRLINGVPLNHRCTT